MNTVYHVYGISDCPSCLRCCADLMDADYEYIFINCDFSRSFRDKIRHELNWPTFPIVICETDEEKTIIGGSEQLKAHMSSLSAI